MSKKIPLNVNNIHAYATWTLNSLGNNFQLEMRLRLFSIGLKFNLCNSRYVCSLKNSVPNENTTLVMTRLKERQNSTDSKFAQGCNYSKRPGKAIIMVICLIVI